MNPKAGSCDSGTFATAEDIAIIEQDGQAVMPPRSHRTTPVSKPSTSIVAVVVAVAERNLQ